MPNRLQYEYINGIFVMRKSTKGNAYEAFCADTYSGKCPRITQNISLSCHTPEMFVKMLPVDVYPRVLRQAIS